MGKLSHKFKIKHTHAPENLTDATIFSKSHLINFEKPVAKPVVEQVIKQLIQDIGEPLAHNGIIVGHIKILAKLADGFMFVSLTRLDRVDINLSDKWTTGVPDKFTQINLDINVLVFGYSKKTINEVVNASLANFQKMSQCEA